MKPVICFGEALIDFLNTGQQDVDTLAIKDYRQYPGGAPANAAVAVAKLGGQAFFAGQVGDDMFGEFLANALQTYGVDTRFLLKHPSAKTALAFVQLDQDGDRSFSFYRHNSADVMFKKKQVDSAWFKGKPIFHFCSNTLTTDDIAECTEYAVAQAQHHQAIISFDVNLRHNLWADNAADINRVNHLVYQAHVVKFSAEELEFLAQGDTSNYIKHALAQGCRLLVVTDGANDICWYTQASSGTIVPPKVKVVDTTAGGDAFIGGLLYGLSHFDDVFAAINDQDMLCILLQNAAACGAHTVTQPGAFPALPDSDDAVTLLQPLPSTTASLTTQHKQKSATMNFYDNHFLSDHCREILRFYDPIVLDNSGGYFQNFYDHGTTFDDHFKQLVSSTRIVVNYAQAAIILDQPEYLRVAKHGLDYIEQVHYQADSQHYAWTLDNHQPLDMTQQAYGYAFVLLAYAAAKKAGLINTDEKLLELYLVLEQRFWQAEYGLYADTISPQGELSAYRGQNANMHLCEAMIAAFEASQNPMFLNRATQLAENICQRQAAQTDGLIWEHFTTDFQPDWEYNKDDAKNLYRPWGFQPGHQTEWAKLLLQLNRHNPQPWLVNKAKSLFDRAFDKAWDHQHGGLIYGFDPEGHWCDDDKYFWVQAESFAAAALLFEATGEAQYLTHYHSIWQYSWDNMVDHVHGAWFRVLRRDNSKYSNEKSAAGAKCDYHTLGACFEVLNVMAANKS
ncbi:MAG: mannose/cellobiose epimerase-like protein (N-acyl-D-glucosamine 2-epimerase family)/sugar [Phenylobacterium sp.]|jgi:mannose/cellobiose epimerase-like protein (N-acyl-D-glucosamine 2-epimerase family)/sugar/nucleoside kinase (ribokinase family)